MRQSIIAIELALLLCFIAGSCSDKSTNPSFRTRSVALTDIGSISFDRDSFDESLITLTTSTEPEQDSAFAVLSGFFRINCKASYYFITEYAGTLPQSGFMYVSMNIPDSLLDTLPPNHSFELFARVYQDDGMERLDNFELMPSTFFKDNRLVQARVPVSLFTDQRRNNGIYEAVFTVAATPGTGAALYKVASCSDPSGECEGAYITSPLPLGHETVHRHFNREGKTHPITGQIKPHYGVDFPVKEGTPVVSAADGVIELVTYNYNAAKGTGYGWYAIVRHDNGSATLYAHLQAGSVQKADEGKPIKQGDLLALSGNSGGSTGPHLHFEYVPNGEIIQSKFRIDPYPCIDAPDAEGSITIRDDGSLADDAFEVYLDEVYLGETSIGGINTIAINNVIPGQHKLTIYAIIAPDDVGTYEISLNNGIVFTDSSTWASSTLEEGWGHYYFIIVPDTFSAPLFKTTPNRINTTIEGN